MSKPTIWKSRTGEEWVLADVAPVLRAAAVTISFGTGRGPWWEVLPIARQVLNDAANAHRQSQADWAAHGAANTKGARDALMRLGDQTFHTAGDLDARDRAVADVNLVLEALGLEERVSRVPR